MVLYLVNRSFIVMAKMWWTPGEPLAEGGPSKRRKVLGCCVGASIAQMYGSLSKTLGSFQQSVADGGMAVLRIFASMQVNGVVWTNVYVNGTNTQNANPTTKQTDVGFCCVGLFVCACVCLFPTTVGSLNYCINWYWVLIITCGSNGRVCNGTSSNPWCTYTLR